jgi:hypothetical protein
VDRVRSLLLGLTFLAVAFAIYAPALDGSFISDDGHYVAQNPYVHDLTPENVIAILNPGSVVALVVENYAPVHLLLHAAEWQLFGEEVRGYHVVNILVHTLASLLWVALFMRWGLGPVAAWLGGGLFLVHPANVEAVAWISQLKTTSAMVLCVGALLVHPRRPGLGALLFGLALLAKPTAAVALFALAAAGWMRGGGEALEGEGREDGGWHWGWVAGWAGLLIAFAMAEFWAFSQTAGQAPPIYPELAERFRSISAIALRYLVMAFTSRGLSTFHETPPADSWLDPWWLASLPVLALLAWRLFFTLRVRRPEAIFWVWALVSFAPICGVIPLPFPMADRYLYFILPGLIGGTALALPELAAWLAPRVGLGAMALDARRGKIAIGLCAALIAFFAVRSHERSRIWRAPAYMMADAELHYPEGAAAQTRKATRAARMGDIDGAIVALQAARARGYNRLDQLLAEPAYASFRDDPRFQAVLDELAREWLDRLQLNSSPSQLELRLIAQANAVLDDLPAAIRALEKALEIEGPISADLEQDLENLRRSQRIREHTRAKRAGAKTPR